MTEYLIISNTEQLCALKGSIEHTKKVAFDCETNAKPCWEERHYITCISLSYQHGCAYVLPIKHFERAWSCAEFGEIKDFLVWLFKDPSITKIAHNLKFDVMCLQRLGISCFEGLFEDTMLMAHIINENRLVGLKELTKEYYTQRIGYEDTIKKYEWAAVPLELLGCYAATDTDITLRLYHAFLDIMFEQQDEYVYNFYRNLLIPASFAFVDIENSGMLVDKKLLDKYIERTERLVEKKHNELYTYKVVAAYIADKSALELEKEAQKLRAKIANCKIKNWKQADSYKLKCHDLLAKLYTEKRKGFELNVNSSKQLCDLLYNADGYNYPLPPDMATGRLKRTTNRVSLRSIKDRDGFITALVTYRTMQKVLSTYLVGIRDKLSPDNKLHATFFLHGTRTGRLSCREPNLQNIITHKQGDDKDLQEVISCVKKIFIAPAEKVLVQIDYSQAELRVAASFAQDPNMLSVYKTGGDLHINSAKAIFPDFDKASAEQQTTYRNYGKMTNFGLIYGMSANTFQKYAKYIYESDLTLAEATRLRTNFFAAYPKLEPFHAKQLKKMYKKGYTRTLFGRKRNLAEVNYVNNIADRISYEKAAINSAIQGTIGECGILACILLNNMYPKINVVNTVHDSIIFTCNKEDVEELLPTIIKVAQHLPTEQHFGRALLDNQKQVLPLLVDASVLGSSWGMREENE